MKRLLLIFALVSIANAQPFPPDSVWTFGFDDGGDEYFYDALEVSDGYLLCGEAREWGALAGEALLVKIDREGELVWARTFSSEGFRRLTDLPTANSAWGEVTSANGQSENIFRIEFDSDGVASFDGLWEWAEEPRRLFAIGEVTAKYFGDEENYYLLFSTRLANQTRNSIHSFACCDTVTDWYATSGIGDIGKSVDMIHGLTICGETLDNEANGKDGLLKLQRSDRDTIDPHLRYEIGGPSDDWFNDIIGDSSEVSFAVVGASESNTNGSADLWVVGTLDSGVVVWSHNYGGLAYEDGVEIVDAGNDGFIIAGNFSSEDIEFEQSDYWLLKVDENGDSVWSVVKGGDEADRCEGMIETENGFLLFGASQSFAAPGWDGCAMLLAYVPDIAATPGSLNFGPVAVGDSSTRMIGLMNTGSNVLTVTGISATENYHANFSGPATVEIGDTLNVPVVFTPQSPGTHVDTLRVTSDAISGVKNVRCLGAGTAAAADDASLLPTEFRLHPPYPNPFNPTTTIAFDVPRDARIELAIFDVQGRMVATLLDGTLSAGTHSREWTCSTCAGGVYFARLRTSEFEGIQKLVLIK